MDSAASPLVAVVIVNYKGRDDTLECLASLAAFTYLRVAVYVVDQASGDGTPDAVRAAFPDVRVIENRENNGFAGGNNVGIRQALADGVDYVFLLNNDTTVAPNLLEPLVKLMAGDETIGACGPQMRYFDAPETVWSDGGSVDWRGRSTLLGDGETANDPPDEPRDVPFVVGAGLIAPRRVWETVGLLDERYFLYYEETDWCARVRKAGYRIVSCPSAVLWHKISRSTGASSPLTLYYMRRNILLYLSQHGARRRMGYPVALADSLRLAAALTRRGEHDTRRVLLRAVGDALRGRWGRATDLS